MARSGRGHRGVGGDGRARTRIALIRALAPIVTAGALVTGCTYPDSTRAQAVILVDVDTLRADSLSCYGYPRPTSPSMDELARNGVRFEWAVSQAPYTLPSQVSILTSVYPWSHGVLENDDRMGDEAATLAESFQRAGWTTAAFVDGGFLKAQFGISQGFEEFTDLDGGGLTRGERPISEWLARRTADERFFLFIHTYDTHSPYAPPEPFRSRFVELAPAPTPGFEPTSQVLEAIRASQWEGPLRRLPPNDLAYARALYDAEVAFVDAWLGRFLESLERSGFAERTVVALVSDHGEEFQEHGSVLHEKLYTTVTRVPWIVRAPGGERGKTIVAPVEMVDVLPTLLELAGIPAPATAQGRSLASTIRTGSEPAFRAAVSMSPFYGEQRAVFDLETQMILTLSSARRELFRYRMDRLGLERLAENDPQRTQALVRLLRQRVGAHPPIPTLAAKVELSEGAVASLRALGYLR